MTATSRLPGRRQATAVEAGVCHTAFAYRTLALVEDGQCWHQSADCQNVFRWKLDGAGGIAAGDQ
jgi:hypothetical protein